MPDLSRCTAERREPEGVVGPVRAVRGQVGVAVAGEEMRRIDHQEIEARGLSDEKPRLAGEEVRPHVHGFALPTQGRKDLGITRQQRPDLDLLHRERRWKRADHVGEPPGFDQRIGFGRDGKDLEAHARRLKGLEHQSFSV